MATLELAALPPLLQHEIDVLTTMGNDYRATRAIWSEWTVPTYSENVSDQSPLSRIFSPANLRPWCVALRVWLGLPLTKFHFRSALTLDQEVRSISALFALVSPSDR